MSTILSFIHKNTVPDNFDTADPPLSYLQPYKSLNGQDELDHIQGRKVAGSVGPVHTYVKTDKQANFKWGVRNYVGRKYARME